MAQYRQIERELQHFLAGLRPPSPDLPRQLAQVLLYIHEHLFDPDLSVKTVKARCCCHDNNVVLRFRVAMRTGVREYIESLRLEAADRLLWEHQYPVYVIAMSVGYIYPETFCRAYQRKFGRQPSRRSEAKKEQRPIV